MIGLLRQHRALLAVLFSLLFVCAQQEAARHALTHFRIGAQHQQLSSSQLDAPCIECELLAGGSTAIPSASPIVSTVFGSYLAIRLAPIAPALTRRVAYRSRAPPALS